MGKEIGDEQRRQATDHYSTSFNDFMKGQEDEENPLRSTPQK